MSKIPVQYRQIQARMQYVKGRVLQLLQLDEQAYGEFQYKCGCSYLQHYIPRDPQGIDMLIQSRMFWSWWKNRWMERDLQFIHSEVADMDAVCKLATYQLLHNPEDLAADIHPNSVVLADSYARMIGELNDKK